MVFFFFSPVDTLVPDLKTGVREYGVEVEEGAL